MSKKIDLVGKTFGQLLVLEEVPERKNGRIFWKCQCSCGTIKEINGGDLKSGKIISCGCSKQKQIVDISNQRFGRLVALYPTEKRKNRQVVWHCKCDCGQELDVRGNSLRMGQTVSCGCFTKDRMSESFTINMIGEKYGALTVIAKSENKSKHGDAIWICKCECGKQIEVSRSNLVRGYRKSCGCLNESIGVKRIKQLLEKHNINYTVEKKFDTCIYPETNTHLLFDFFIENKYLLEFDGEQHFRYSSTGWNNKEHYEKLVKRDNYKNNWCKENNIPLIRISYKHENNIVLEDLLLETTKYRVV